MIFRCVKCYQSRTSLACFTLVPMGDQPSTINVALADLTAAMTTLKQKQQMDTFVAVMTARANNNRNNVNRNRHNRGEERRRFTHGGNNHHSSSFHDSGYGPPSRRWRGESVSKIGRAHVCTPVTL